MKKVLDVKSIHRNSSTPAAEDIRAKKPAISKMGEVYQFSSTELEKLKIVHAGMQNNRVLNVFRELRTQLLREQNKKNFICLVSSICSDGGASYVASNLAAAFALDKEKTSLLIDANLYAPQLNELIVGEASFGVTDYLSDSGLSIKDIVYATGIPRVRVIPIGQNSEGAAEYFSSLKMTQFTDELRARYPDRFIFIDSPPVAESSEARILAELVDVVVLVVPHAKVTPEQVNNAISVVGQKKLAGLIYNN